MILITIKHEGLQLKKIILTLILVFTIPFTLLAKTNTDVQFIKHSKTNKSKLTQYLIKKIYHKKERHFGRTSHVASSKNIRGTGKNVLKVTATAYTSSKRETQGDPTIGAWGTKLRPGVKTIAISRDLLRRGMTNGTRVTIDGLPGTYIVRDKMAARWTKKIDIYMGYSRSRAMNWGKRKVVIRWA